MYDLDVANFQDAEISMSRREILTFERFPLHSDGNETNTLPEQGSTVDRLEACHQLRGWRYVPNVEKPVSLRCRLRIRLGNHMVLRASEAHRKFFRQKFSSNMQSRHGAEVGAFRLRLDEILPGDCA